MGFVVDLGPQMDSAAAGIQMDRDLACVPKLGAAAHMDRHKEELRQTSCWVDILQAHVCSLTAVVGIGRAALLCLEK